MEGIEKITARIAQDAQAEIDEIAAQADAQAGQIRAQARAEAEKLSGDILSRGEKAARERLERLKSAAQMERRKLELDAKQTVLGEAFNLALERLCSLPEKACVELLARLALEASSTGREELVFSFKDRSRLGRQVVAAANEAMVKAVAPELPGSVAETKVGALLEKVVNSTAAMVTGAGMLTLSERTAPIEGGFILVDGDVEVNCAFETLVRLQREKLEKEVANVLFD